MNPRQRWWKKNKPHQQVAEDFKLLFRQQNQRHLENLTNLRLYGNRYVTGLTGDTYEQTDPLQHERLTLNVIQSVIDAATSKIATNKTRSQFLTEGGKWKQQQQAMQLSRFVDGQFYKNKTYPESEKSFKDACIFDMGVVKHWIDDRVKDDVQIMSERVVPTEVWVDQVDAKYGKPRMLYQIKEVGKEVVAGNPKWKKYADRIQQATVVDPNFQRTDPATTLADPCSIMEAWRLPSYQGGPDGKHIICLDSVTLLEEKWEDEYFPFSFFRWNERAFGFYGQGLAEQLRTIQISINKILRQIERHMDKASSFVLAERGAKVVKSHLVNTPWTLLEYTGAVPTFATVQSISPEYFAQLDRLYSRAFEIAGISQLFAQSKVPSNLKSGRAISEAKDTESERFLKAGSDWSEYQLDIGNKQIQLAKIVDDMLRDAGDEDGYTVMAKNENDSLDRIRWQDVALEDDAYIMQAYPTSYLPKTPAFRIQAALDLAEAVPQLQPYMPKLIEEIPDLKAAIKQLIAPREYIEKITDRMLYADAETEEELEALYEPPDSFIMSVQDPSGMPAALVISRGKLFQARIDGAPPERLDLLMRFMTEVDNLMAEPPGAEDAEAEAAAAAMAAGEMQAQPGALGAVGMAPQAGDITVAPQITVPQAARGPMG
jgi:hypothetical protein